MSHIINYPIPPLYYILYNVDANGNKKPVSYGCVDSQQTLESGLDTLEVFESEEEFIFKLLEYGIDPATSTEPYL